VRAHRPFSARGRTEAYTRSAGSHDEAWHDFARRSVDDLLDSLAALAGGDSTEGATLALAVMRGLVLDLLATNDLGRVNAAWKHFLDTHYPAWPAGSTQYSCLWPRACISAA